MNVFAVVYDPSHLERFCRDFARLVVVSEGAAREPLDRLLGIVVWSGTGPDPVPEGDAVTWPAGGGPVPVVTTFELSGIWSLHWVPEAVTRDQLVAALDTLPDAHPARRAARFVPVFAPTAPADQREEAWRSLASRWPGRVLSPVVAPPAPGSVAA